MELPIYQVDAFTGRLFHGNPAAVVLMRDPLPDDVLQAIAAENNLAETAFITPGADSPGFRDPSPAGEARFGLRWFTPKVEIDLCGHATLASAHVLFTLGHAQGKVVFDSASGPLTVTRSGDLLELDFPARPPEPAPADPGLGAALGQQPLEYLKARDGLAVYATEAEVAALRPDFAALARIDVFAIAVTAPGSDCDFVSRFFAPGAGIDEDPVTGSAHTTLVPYWSRRLGKKRLHARQISERGGELFCEDAGARVKIAGKAVEYLKGTIRV